MNKKTTFLSLLTAVALLCAISSHSQVVIIKLMTPPPNQWHVEDLWNLTLTNTTAEKPTVFLYGTVEEQGDGLIFEGTSAVFELAPNFSGRIDPSQLEPADVGYANKDYEDFVLKIGTVPEGMYTICLYVKEEKSGEKLGQDCIVQNIMHSAPPQLITPLPDAMVSEELPVFSWLPPMLVPAGETVTYALRIVEQLDSQPLLEAMESNPAWFIEKGIVSTSFQLSVKERPLEPGDYAWQITAFNGKQNYEIGQSEVWGFTYGKPYLIQVDSLIIVRTGEKTAKEQEYHVALFVTNPNPTDAELSVTEVSSTPRSPISYEWDYDVVMIPSSEQGIMTGKIYTSKTAVKEISMEILLEDKLNPKINVSIIVNGPVAPIGDSFDFGDAVSYPSATHRWPVLSLLSDPYTGSWLGNNPNCINCSNVRQDHMDFETAQLPVDPLDDGVHFFNPISNYCVECALDSIDVTFSVAQYYSRNVPLLFHGWFDFTRDGDWDDCGYCLAGPGPDTNISKGPICEHVEWKSYRRLCPPPPPGTGKIPLNSQEFKIYPSTWGTDIYCATYRLYFISGFDYPAFNPQSGTIWTRFRLTPATPNSTNAGNYSGEVTYGEVEDYPIVCDSTPPIPVWDFGDAPDELDNLNLHYCTHQLSPGPTNPVNNSPRISPSPWTNYDAANHEDFSYEWLGNNANGCTHPCSGVSADAESNGRTIDLDNLDDGVDFSLFNYPFNQCQTQTVDVMINTDQTNAPSRYSGGNLILHAWFDWNQNGDWDERYLQCSSVPAYDHVYWLTAQPLCPAAGPTYIINSHAFSVNPVTGLHWPTNDTCQIFRLTFLSGDTAGSNPEFKIATDTLWSRFRLYYQDDNGGNYYGGVPFGEVEDYIVPITTPCDSADYGDAPDELDPPFNTHYCTHNLNYTQPPARHGDLTDYWLGNIANGCACTGPSADKECDGRTINQDSHDNGVSFQNFNYNFNPCEIQSVDVLVNRANALVDNLYLNAWFDWNRDGDWDDTYDCGQYGYQPVGDHIWWLSYQLLCPLQIPPPAPVSIGAYTFKMKTNLFPDGENCQMFRLIFVSGDTAGSNPEFPVVTDSLWCRFRLSDVIGGMADEYFGSVSKGEVEDYPIFPDSTQAGCEGPFIDSRDGKPYHMVQIGTQCWMAENLDIGTPINVLIGDTVLQSLQTNNLVIEKYCYKDVLALCQTYGGLYEWAEALNYQFGAMNNSNLTLPSVNIQGICPTDWHIPSDQEWKDLELFLGMPQPDVDNMGERGAWQNIGGRLKSLNLWNPPNSGATNSSGFSAFPAGARIEPTTNFTELGDHAHFWSTEDLNATYAIIRHLKHGTSAIGRDKYPKKYGHSVRCVRNY